MSYAAAAFAIVRRDFLTDLSYRFRFAGQLITAFTSVALFYYLSRLVKVGFSSAEAYFGFAVIGIVILQVLNSTLIGPPTSIRQELVAGTWERLLLSPFGAVRSVVAVMLYPMFRACVLGVVTLGVAASVFGLKLHWETAFLAIPAAIIATAAFIPFGVLMAGLILMTKQAARGAAWVLTGVSLVGGLYFPTTLLPSWIRWVSEVQPFTPAVDLLRYLLVDTPLRESAWIEVAKLVGFTAVLTPLALALVGAVLRVTRRKGTIIEY